MQKEELLHLHMLLIHIKKYYETTTGDEVYTPDYDVLGVSPAHIHKNKISHKKAILALGEDLVHQLRDVTPHAQQVEGIHKATHNEGVAQEH
ncbi:UPF0058 family protein [Methanofollis sp. W23]|uniref:UPF0058 family protein n=1 Tax=Methanofollis sp. W23 TaxID=2817849 RepID=UPI001AE110A2